MRGWWGGNARVEPWRAGFVSVVRGLMAELSDASAYFVRCIGPTLTAAAWEFHGAHVLQQLRVSGTSAMLRMVQTAHPTLG